MNSYELSRIWFDWCFENQEKIKPNHTALYFFIIEHNNRMGWVEKFGLPTEMAKSAIGISSYNTYINTLNDLVDWGFIIMIQKSKNQYSSNIVAISKNDKAINKALDKALIKHGIKLSESIDSINKQINNKQEDKILNNSLLSEIKISDDKKFFLVKGIQIEIENNFLDYYKTALGFQKLFIKNLKEKNSPFANQLKSTFKNYIYPIKLMIEKDGVTFQQLRDAYNFLNSPEGEFWKSNILSTKKLREQLSVLLAKKNTKVISLQKQEQFIPDPNNRKRF